MPLTMPATRHTVSPASADWVNGRITGDGPGHRRLKYRSTRARLASLGELAGGLCHQRLVRGDHRTCRFPAPSGWPCAPVSGPRSTHRCRRCRRNQGVDVVGEQLGKGRRDRRDLAHPDAAQFQRAPMPGNQIGGAVVDDAHHLGAHIALTPLRRWAYASLALTQTRRSSTFSPSKNQPGLAVPDGDHGLSRVRLPPALTSNN